MIRSISKLGTGIIIAVIMFTGLSAFGPTNTGTFGPQKAAAAGCTTNYYRITADSVSVRRDPNYRGLIFATFYKNQVVTGIHGGVWYGWTQVNAWGFYEGSYGTFRGYIPNEYRVYLGCN